MIEFTGMTPLINVEDAARSIAFYRDVLGFEVAHQWEHEGVVRWARLQAGSVALMINQGDGADSGERRKRERAYSDMMLFCAVADARRAHREITQKGVEADDPEHQEYGWEFHVRDPDGYVLGFTDTH